MRFSESFVKSSAKMMIIAGLAIVSGSVFAQSGTSILNQIKNQDAANNTAASVQSMTKKGDDKGDKGDKGGKGGKNDDKGKGHNPPGCVPEPATMLAMGLGAGFMALKRRRAAKAA